MKIYKSKTKKYRIRKRKYSDGNIVYYIQWKHRSWYGIFWSGRCDYFNNFSTFDKVKNLIRSLIEINDEKYNLRI